MKLMSGLLAHVGMLVFMLYLLAPVNMLKPTPNMAATVRWRRAMK